MKQQLSYSLLGYVLLLAIVNLAVNFDVALPKPAVTFLRSYGINTAGWRMYLGKASSVTWVKVLYLNTTGAEMGSWILPDGKVEAPTPNPFRHLAVYLSRASLEDAALQNFMRFRCHDFEGVKTVTLLVRKQTNTCPATFNEDDSQNGWWQKYRMDCA